MSDGQKYDGGKVPLQLLSTTALNKIAEVMGFGAQKYAPNAWRDGMNWSRLIGAALRHITAYNGGESLDPESGLSHMAHAACCVMFLLEYEETFPDKDDRFILREEENHGKAKEIGNVHTDRDIRRHVGSSEI